MTFFFTTLLSLSSPALACGDTPCSDSCPLHAASTTADHADTEAEGTQLTVNVTGLTCSMSSGELVQDLMSVDGVFTAAANHETGAVEINYDTEKRKILPRIHCEIINP